MPMSYEMDLMRKSVDSVAVYTLYLRTGMGGYLYTMNEELVTGAISTGLQIGQSMSYQNGIGLPGDYTYDYVERDDILMDFDNRITTYPKIVLADGIQENNGVVRYKSTRKTTVSFKLNNYDNYFSTLWGKESLLNIDVFCKMGFLGLDYIYFYELIRGRVVRVRFTKSVLEFTLEY